MKYHFRIYKDQGTFWAECMELPGCKTQGDTRDELMFFMEEALNLYLDEPDDSKFIFPLPNNKIKLTKNIVPIAVEPQISFSFLLRRTRLLKKYTQNQMKELLQYKSIYAYQKLERSRYANPTLKSLMRIKEVLPEFPLKLLVA